MFYDESVKEVLDKLNTSIDGLNDKEVNKRLEEYGENKLAEEKRKSKLILFLSQLKDPMIIILIIASIVSYIVSIINNEVATDSIIIIAIVIINAFMGYFQEEKADKALDALKKMQVTNVKVIRNGKTNIIDSKLLVPGDILLLESGDIVPADARIINCSSLKTEEASLTGESVPVIKESNKIKSNTVLSERCNMVYSGTIVSYGKALVVVCTTGMNTEFGKIASMLTKEVNDVTPLQRKVEEISKVLSIIIMIIIGIMFLLGLYKRLELLEILMLSLSLAVAAIPEGLPAVITITLSLGISSMAKKRAIIRKLPSVETLGCTEIICSDKTGTITKNQMSVEEIFYNNKYYHNENPDGFMLEMLALNNDVSKVDGKFIGDPTEIALYEYADKFIDVKKVKNTYTRVMDLPFDSNRKMMSTLNRIDDKYILITKGSFESIINHSSKIIIDGNVKKLTNKMKDSLVEVEQSLSSKAYRILAFAYNEFKDKPKRNIKEDDLIFVGLVCMIDPPRDDVAASIKECIDAHIKPIMITGDSLGIGIAIAKKTGILYNENEAILGSELEKYTPEELKEVVKKYSVYARVTPNQKLMIVNAWKANGKVVAMTGDGVNDAPAIKEANIGIGMGINGTEVSKNVSDVVLSDDSFSTIVLAVREGRRIYDNIRNVLVYLLAGNLAEILVVFIPMLFGLEIFIPIQLLYINLITDSFPAIALAFEKEAPNIMKRDIRPGNSKFFTPFMLAKIGISSILKTIAVLLVYFINVKNGVDIATTMSFLTLILLEMGYAYSCKNLKVSILDYDLLGNKTLNKSMLLLSLINIIILFTPIGSIFSITRLSLVQVIYSLLVVLFIFIIDEISKEVITSIFKD